MNYDLSATETNNSVFPRVGDVIKCSDGDIGIVVSTKKYPHSNSKDILVEARWINAGLCTDMWRSEDFSNRKELFRVISRL